MEQQQLAPMKGKIKSSVNKGVRWSHVAYFGAAAVAGHGVYSVFAGVLCIALIGNIVFKMDFEV